MAEIGKNSRITFKTRAVSVQGDGIGVCEENGMTVFCFGADAGETVTGTVIKKASNYLVAKSDKKPVSDKCPVYPACGGCSLLHFPYERTLEIKYSYVKDCLERIAGLRDVEISPIIPSPEISKFRNKAIYRFKGSKDGIKCGFFRRGSHDVVPSESCWCEKPLCREICSAMLEILNEKKLSVYDEETGKGILRALMVRVSVDEKAMVCLSVNADSLSCAGEIAARLSEKIPSVVSFYVNSNTSKTNTVFSGTFTCVFGSKTLTDRIGEAKFEIAPESFFQVNPYATPMLYDKAFEYAFGDRDGEGKISPSAILDIYCGIGTIGVYFCLKDRAGVKIDRIFGVDYTEAAIREATSAAKNNTEAEPYYLSGDAGEVLSAIDRLPDEVRSVIEEADTAVVDPPRKGLDERIPGILAGLSLKRIVYISCNPATLARDIVKFSELGYTLTKVTPCDMFPFEGHVEVVALLTARTS